MEVMFLGGAAKSFFHAWQNQWLAASENRHIAKPIWKAGNGSMITYLLKTKPWELSFSSLEGWVGARALPIWGHRVARMAWPRLAGPGHRPAATAISAWLAMIFICWATFSQPCCKQKGKKRSRWREALGGASSRHGPRGAGGNRVISRERHGEQYPGARMGPTTFQRCRTS